jgi:four helix bundle protein
MRNFKELKVWEKAHGLALQVYKSTKTFPVQEQYGITSQMRRAAVSISTNIAEGCGRSSEIEFARFLEIAFASASELEYLALLSKDLELFDSSSYQHITTQAEEIKRMLYTFIQKVKERSKGSPSLKPET